MGKRRTVGVVFVAGFILAATIALFFLDLEMSMRWLGGGSGGGSNLTRVMDAEVIPDADDSAEGGDGDDTADADTRFAGGATRAYAVIFTGVHDPLVLERAVALWNSLRAFKARDDHIVAIVPTFIGLELQAPLRAIGYRVLARDSPIPPWKSNGRFVQQSLAAIAGGGGFGGGGGSGGWSLLALEALSLTEYEEVIVLDHKMIVLPPPIEPPAPNPRSNRGVIVDRVSSAVRSSRGVDDGGGGTARGREDDKANKSGISRGGAGEGGNRGRRNLILDDGDSHTRDVGTRDEEKEPEQAGKDGDTEGNHFQDEALRLVPEGSDWAVAFAPGNTSSPAHGFGGAKGKGLQKLPREMLDLFLTQHGALMALRPDQALYDAASNLLCKGDTIMTSAYPDLPPEGSKVNQAFTRAESLENRATATPLLHLTIAFAMPGDASTEMPLRDCSGAVDDKAADGASSVRAGGDARTGTNPIVWCASTDRSSQSGADSGGGHAEDEVDGRVDGDGDGDGDGEDADPVAESRGRRLSVPGWRRHEKNETKNRYQEWKNDITKIHGAEKNRVLAPGGGDGLEALGTLASLGWEENEGTMKRFTPIRGRDTGVPEARTRDVVSEEWDRDHPPREESDRRQGFGRGLSNENATEDGTADGAKGLPVREEDVRGHRRLQRSKSDTGLDRENGPEMPDKIKSKGEEGEKHAKGGGDMGNMNDNHGDEENGKDGDQGKEGSDSRHGGQAADRGDDKTSSAVSANVEEEQQTKEKGIRQETTAGNIDTEEVVQAVAAGSARFAWIPGDPCSCMEAVGPIGEACRGWLVSRAELSEAEDQRVSDADPRTVCQDGVFVSPRAVPNPTSRKILRQMEMSAKIAGPPPRSEALKEEGGEGGEDGDGIQRPQSPISPPPLWQTHKPSQRAVVTAQDIRAFQHFWLANVEKKILMVAIPKVACTQVHALFLRMQGSNGWNSQNLIDIHFHKDQVKYKINAMADIGPEQVSRILSDPTWTKAVFVRDPAERLLSCFLDKIVHRKSYSVNIFKSNDVLSFEMFANLLSQDAKSRFGNGYDQVQLGLTRRSNPHWRPQLFFSLAKFLPYFDFIGDFNHVQAHSEELLRRAGLWEEFGSSGWGPSGKNAFFQRSTVQGHATGSQSSKGLYYPPHILQTVREAYGPTDYRMMASLGWWNETEPY